MTNIDQALAANPKLEPAKLAEVQKLRADGETLHKQGKHAESEAALGQADPLADRNQRVVEHGEDRRGQSHWPSLDHARA